MSNPIGRNQPCPCGSGRRYKQCCLRREPEAGVAWSRAEREAAWARLLDYLSAEEFAAHRETAFALFWRLLLREPEPGLAELMDLKAGSFTLWFALDKNLESGRAPVSWFLANHSRRLTPGMREYLRRLAATEVRLYEVREVRLDQGMSLTDLWTGAPVEVKEKSATHQIARWDVLGARVMPGPTGALEFEDIPYIFPPAMKDELLSRLRTIAGRKRSDAAFFRRVAPLLNHWWMDDVANAAPPEAVTVEGDPLVFAKVVFDGADAASAASLLAGCDDFEATDDGGWTWLEPGEGMRRILGTVVVKGPRLILDTHSEARARRGRALLEQVIPGLTYRTTRLEDALAAVARAPVPVRSRKDELPPDLEAQLVGEFLDRHYRGWSDEPLPALDGRTPRAAARLKTQRPKVVALLKEFENHSARSAADGRPVYDFGWLWGELGLDRA